MLRFYYVILISLPFIIYYILLAEYYVRNRELYNEESCYKLAKSITKRLKKNARIRTISYGEELLPKEGGYIMYANHQGKYDALGIISEHKKTCSVIMDETRSKVIFVDQFVKLLDGVRLSRTDFRQQVQASKDIQKGVEMGKRYIYFPEGKYDNNGNELQEFKSGAFNCVKKSKTPIVPVAIYDSHLPFDFNSLRKVTTQVYFLEPIYYEDYKDKSTHEISCIVKDRINDALVCLEDKRRERGLNVHFYKNI